MRAFTLPISRPSLKAASAALLAGAVLFMASTAHADDRHGRGGHDRGRGHHGGYHGHHHAKPYRYASPHQSRNINHFSLSIGAPSYRHSHYRSSYYRPAYYPRPYVYPVVQPVAYPVYTPMQYGPVINRNDGRYCREYTQQVMVGSRMQESYGIACMQPDGAWQIDS